MTCFAPKDAWWSVWPNKSGAYGLIFHPPARGAAERYLQVPCGQCIGCRVDRSRDWAVRCYHEAQMHENNAFLTLTYNDESLPSNGSLRIRDYQLFMKKLREEVGAVRFLHCGEYGGLLGRPHYHACLFGQDFSYDKEIWKIVDKTPLWRSSTLDKIWGLGYCSIGTLTFQSAAYTARYILKKMTGDGAKAHYAGKQPEYVTMSRRPGIGHTWYEKYGANEIWPDDYIVIDNRKFKVPKYYDRMLEKEDPIRFDAMKLRRQEYGEAHEEDRTPERLAARKEVFVNRINLLTRDLESE